MTRPYSFLFAAALLTLGLSGCATPSASSIDAPQTIEDADDGYLILPGDTLEVTVYGDDVMTKTYTVNSKGNIALPLIGQTKVKGMSPDDAEKKIVAALKKSGMMTSASVTIDSSKPRPIFVLGEVKTAGTYPYGSAMSALQAVATAGGYTPRASQNNFLIDRKMSNGKIIRMNANENTPVMPGDTLIVRERIF